MPAISIIVPVYNTEKYLHRCIDSILAQTFADFELILIDDGSTDKSPQICDEYRKKDGRIIVIHQSNAGVSVARNAGLDIASGNYIMFCDSDDYVDPNWCWYMIDTAKMYPDKGVVCNAWRACSDNNTKESIGTQTGQSTHLMTYFDIYKLHLSGSACWRIFKQNIIEQMHLKFETGRTVGEDAAFCACYCRNFSEHIYIEQPLYYYTYRSESAVHRFCWDTLAKFLPLYMLRLPLIKENELEQFADIHLTYFIGMLPAVFDKRNTMSFWQKISYNQRMLTSEAFQTCIKQASGKSENPIVILLLKTKCYYLYWLFQKSVELKNKIWRKR